MFFTLILSLLAIIGVSIVLNEIISVFQVIGLLDSVSFDFSFIISTFETDFQQGLSLVGILAWGIVQLYGIPLLIFLVSLHGLTAK
jgi:hypothetical protein